MDTGLKLKAGPHCCLVFRLLGNLDQYADGSVPRFTYYRKHDHLLSLASAALRSDQTITYVSDLSKSYKVFSVKQGHRITFSLDLGIDMLAEDLVP